MAGRADGDSRPHARPAGVAGSGQDLAAHRQCPAPGGRGPGRRDLHLSGPGFDWGGWFTRLAPRGAQGLTTDDNPVYGPALDASGLDQILLPFLQRRARERLVASKPILLALWQAVA